MAQSLEGMIEELTCSICLCLFSTPVTIPCGHNFCSQCLELTWKESYTCPQCRFSFTSKPELRKNTLLSNLVSMAQTAQGEEVTAEEQCEDKSKQEAEEEEDDEEEEDQRSRNETVMCDSCMKNPASKTCLTCMASFCQDHLLPHLENPTFSDHQLSPPLRDLRQRKCTEHNKLMDHYCWDHSKCICCYCALNHKTCKTYTLEEGKRKKELYYTDLLRSLDQKIERAASTAEDVTYEQRKVTGNVRRKKELLEAEFLEIKALIDEEQRKGALKIEDEEKKMNNKFNFTHKVLSKKKDEFQLMRSKVQSLLQEQDDLQFLKRATKLRDTTSKEPYKPKIEFDEKLLNNMYRNTVSLKEIVKHKLAHGDQTPQWRSKKAPEPGLKPEPEESDTWKPPHPSKKPNEDGPEKPSKRKEAPEWKSRKMPEPGPKLEPEEPGKGKPPHPSTKPNEDEKSSRKNKQAACDSPPTCDPGTGPANGKPRRAPRSSSAAPLDSREQLVKYAERLAANINTAHKKVFLYDRFTKMAVSETPQNYPDNPHRFVSCSQVLAHQGFRGGIHYWEVEKEGGNFSGFGVAYQSIARFGTESRLGRNKVSWCIEWCNGKLQAWHDDKQTDLTTPNATKYGVLLNLEHGYVAFYCVGKKCSQIYKFNARFTEAVYPAFWMFSSKTVLTLCQAYEL